MVSSLLISIHHVHVVYTTMGLETILVQSECVCFPSRRPDRLKLWPLLIALFSLRGRNAPNCLIWQEL
jgi:hypothetical protein